MIQRLFFLILVQFAFNYLEAQEAPNVANSAQQTAGGQSAGKLMNTPVNLFTGIPDIGVPIYNYDGADGMNLNVSLSYHAGGIQVLEQPSVAGLGWALNAGGAVTRTIRGAPDDLPTYGFMYAGAIPADYRADGSKYYYDSIDAQQDVFQFSCGAGSGKFYLGKNGQIAIVPDSRISITYTTGYIDVSNTGITSFTLRGEDGCRYIFSDVESSKITNQTTTDNIKSNYTNKAYASSWYLSKVIAPFGTDTIYFKYSTKETNAGFPLTQSAFGDLSTQTITQVYKPSAYNSSKSKVLDSIMLPGNKKIKFYYNYRYENIQTVVVDGIPTSTPMDSSLVLNNIYITDTILRKGYNLGRGGTLQKLLLSVTPFTAKEKMPGYTFSYYPYTGVTLQTGNEDQQALNLSARDHWGFYNGKYNNGGVFPNLNSWMGADRSPDFSKAVMNGMQYTYLPGGGFVYYEYELNDHVPYTKSAQQITVNTSYNTLTSAVLTDIVSGQRAINISLDNSSVDRTGTPPLSNTSIILTCNIVDAANTNTVYATYSLNLAELYYTGFKLWNFAVPDGTYKLQTTLSGGTVTSSLPVIFSWENKLADNTVNSVIAGGIRVKRITRKNASDDVNPIITEYKYITTDGKSSGFLGDIPRYDYAYRNKVVNGSATITDFTVISSEPVANMDYAQGSPVGYSRVEVIKGTAANNIGKEVYEFISPKDISVNYSTASNPYGPTDMKEWALGLPKRTTVYDNTGNLLKSSVPTYNFLLSSYNNSYFKSVKLNHIATYTIVSGGNTNISRVFTGQEYFPSGGRVVLTQSIDTAFHPGGSIQISSQTYEYDAVYYNNVTKVTSSYDRSRGLNIETRMYYPFNYTLSGTTIGKLKDSGISTPVIATEKWITGDGNNRIVSGSITDMQQLSGGYIRPAGIYALETNKPIPQATIGSFSASVLNRNSTYFMQQATMPVYDAKGNILQTTSTVSGQSESVIMDYDNRYAIAKATNTAYADIAYTSFESDGTGNWTVSSATRDNTTGVTGKKSYNLTNGNISKTGLNSATTYLVTFWAKTGASVTINSASAGSSISLHSGWNLYNKQITGVTTITIAGTGIIDELRLHPKDANMVTTTYEPLVGATSICDANNTIMYNEYDDLSRLKIVRDNDGNILKKMGYSDTAMAVNLTPVWSPTGIRWGSGANNCVYDSSYSDNNPFSASYKQVQWIYKGTNCCLSPAHTNDITYKVVNGVCELGLRWNSSTSSGYVNGVLKWKCKYYYKWSDGSRTDADLSTGGVMDDFEEFNDAPCQLGYGF